MKLTKQQLRKIIQEELNYIIQEEEIDENFLKKALAGAAIAGGLTGVTPAYANKPDTSPATTQVAQQGIEQAVNEVLNLQRETYSVNFKKFDTHINKDLGQVKLSFDNFGSLEGMQKTIDYLSKDLGTLISNQQNSKEEAKFKEHNIKLKAAVDKLKNYI